METPVRAYEEKLYKQEIFGVFGPFFLLFSPSKDQREARKGESTRNTRTLRNLFVYHALAEFRSGVVCPIRWLVVETLA